MSPEESHSLCEGVICRCVAKDGWRGEKVNKSHGRPRGPAVRINYDSEVRGNAANSDYGSRQPLRYVNGSGSGPCTGE